MADATISPIRTAAVPQVESPEGYSQVAPNGEQPSGAVLAAGPKEQPDFSVLPGPWFQQRKNGSPAQPEPTSPEKVAAIPSSGVVPKTEAKPESQKSESSFNLMKYVKLVVSLGALGGTGAAAAAGNFSLLQVLSGVFALAHLLLFLQSLLFPEKGQKTAWGDLGFALAYGALACFSLSGGGVISGLPFLIATVGAFMSFFDLFKKDEEQPQKGANGSQAKAVAPASVVPSTAPNAYQSNFVAQ